VNDEFWRSVIQDAGVDAHAIAELARLETILARSSFIARHNFSLKALARNPEVQRFLTIQFALFESVARLSGKSILIDSSKAGPRAWLLACDPRIRIVHLYRDPGDVIASWRSKKFDQGLNSQMKRMPVSRAAMDWWKVEQLILILARQCNVARIDYENLCTSPQNLVTNLIEHLALDEAIQPNWIDPSTIHQGEDYHSLNGNPDRFERGPIKIAFRGTDWKTMEPSERFRVRSAAAAMKLIYASRA
jgi:Sulfotransferase family